MEWSLMIHGGAGSMAELSSDERHDYEDGIRRVLESGRAVLESGACALDVVTHCASMLEDDPRFNAGRGSVLNARGVIEMDAAIMDGRTLQAGSVVGVQRVRNPIQLARSVMVQTEHVMLAGQGAQEFAEQSGLPLEPPEYFRTEKRVRQLEQAQKAARIVLDLDASSEDPKKYGTIGAVARDMSGHLAAATSTGGITNKQFGRVGDSPVLGAGVYADDATCAVSATGYGEQFLRTCLAKYASDVLALRGGTAADAVTEAMRYLTEKVRGLGGIILIDAEGNCADGFTSGGMIRGRVRSDGTLSVALD